MRHLRHQPFAEQIRKAVTDGKLEKFRITKSGEVEDELKSPDYFPENDKNSIARWKEKNFDDMIAGKDYYDDMLEPAESPDQIPQGTFAISEKTPVVLEGVGPCTGVMLINLNTGRVLAAHLEAREEKTTGHLVKEAKKFTKMVVELFNDNPTKIVVTSMILGADPYHTVVEKELRNQFPEVKIQKINAVKVTFDPTTKKLYAEDNI